MRQYRPKGFRGENEKERAEKKVSNVRSRFARENVQSFGVQGSLSRVREVDEGRYGRKQWEGSGIRDVIPPLNSRSRRFDLSYSLINTRDFRTVSPTEGSS